MSALARLALTSALVPSLLACKPAPSQSAFEGLPMPPGDDVAAASPRALPPPPPAAIYGHVRVPSPSKLLAELRNVVPLVQRPALDEAVLRSALRMQLGEKAAIADHLDLSRPMGCVVASPKRSKVPVACAVGYVGGLSALLEDLGPKGRMSAADDHAHYQFGSDQVFLAGMGDHVAIAVAPELIADTRAQLQREIIDAPAGSEELVAVMHPAVIFEDARAEIDDFIAKIATTPSVAANPGYAELQRRQWLSYEELEHIAMWTDLADGGVRFGYRGTALPGTATETGYRAGSDLGLDAELLGALPADALAVAGLAMSFASLAEDPNVGAYMAALGAAGPDAVEFARRSREGMLAWTELGTGHAAVGLLHERGTKGAVVMAYRIKPGVDAVPKLRALMQGIYDGPYVKGLFDLRLREGAFRAGKVRGDLYAMTPTAKALAQPGMTALVDKLGPDPSLQAAYAQRGDVLYLAMSAGKGADRALRRVLAVRPGTGVDARTEVRALAEAHRADHFMMGVDVAAVAKWLVAIGAIEPPAFPMPPGLDGAQVSWRSSGERQREVVVAASPALVQALVQLATK